MRWAITLAVALGLSAALAVPASARADDAVALAATAPAPASMARHAVYVEALGKGGLWGLGYAYQLRSWLAVGGVGSFTILDSQRILSLSPSVTVYPLGTRHHRWFVDAGPQLVRVATPSPVPEWTGTHSTGVGAQLATGYEYRAGLLARVFAMGVTGGDSVAPWLGADLGWTF